MKINKYNIAAEDPAADKDKIIRYAEEFYLKEGFYKTSMDKIASDLKMSKKTIYKYFPSKEILVAEVIHRLMSGLQNQISQIFSEDSDAVIKVKKMHEILGSNLIRFSDKWINDLRLHMPALWLKVDEFRTKKMYQVLSRIFDQGKKEGLIADRPNEILITIFIASVRAIVSPDFLYYNKFSYLEAVNITFDILFNGCLTKEGVKTYKRKLKEKRNETFA